LIEKIIGFIGLSIVLMYTFAVSVYWYYVDNSLYISFLSANIADIMNPIISIILAISIAYYINIKFPKRTKINDVYQNIIDEYMKILNSLDTKFLEYATFKNSIYDEGIENSENKIVLLKYENEIKNLFKKGNLKLNTIKEVQESFRKLKLKFDYKSMQKELNNLKKLVTNNTFGQKKVYKKSDLNLITIKFEEIRKNISLEKINLLL